MGQNNSLIVGVIEATIGTNPSYIWRSIHGTLHLLKAGARWRIGSGRDVGILNELWLPDSLDPTIQTLALHGLETTKVCSLMSMNEKRWDSDILNDLFSARDSDLILKVSLSIREENDGWSLWVPGPEPAPPFTRPKHRPKNIFTRREGPSSRPGPSIALQPARGDNV